MLFTMHSCVPVTNTYSAASHACPLVFTAYGAGLQLSIKSKQFKLFPDSTQYQIGNANHSQINNS